MITARTPNQKKYIKGIKDNDVTICVGISGVGKSYIALGYALELLKRDKIDKIYISRPMQSVGTRDFPYLKGGLDEKIEPYYMPLLCILNSIIGEKQTKTLIALKKIELTPIELMRGRTFDNCVVLIDEAQNITPQQAVMSITRMGENCKLIYTGDLQQSDLTTYNGLALLTDTLKNTDLVCYIKMLDEDMQRNPKIVKILKAIDWQGSY